jgi:tetratricopeptide (TPR) repeat protein
MRCIEDFSADERQRASFKLRYVHTHDAAKIEFKPTYWFVPLMIRLIDRVDDLVINNPKRALKLAEPLVRLADRIPVQEPPDRVDSTFYLDRSERLDFRVWTRSQLCSAYRASGKHEEAALSARQALQMAQSASDLVRAEASRRVAVLETDLGNFERAATLIESSIATFEELRDNERSALAHICRGNIANLTKGAGNGSVDYAIALQRASRARSRRAGRAIVMAAGNLAIDASRSPSVDAETAIRWVSSAIKSMKGRPTTVPKLMIRWAEATLAYRFGLGRYSMRWLEKVRDRLLALGALPQGIACIVDLLTIAAKEVGEDELARITRESLRSLEAAVERSTPDEYTKTVLRQWSENPSDVELLRRQVRRKQVTRLD